MNRKYLISLTLAFFPFIFCQAQAAQNFNMDTSFQLKKEIDVVQLEKIKRTYGQHKKYPKDLEVAGLTALSFYPELKETAVHFTYKEQLKPTMRSIPCIPSLVRKRTKRVYFIRMNKEKIKHLSFNALVGVLGHELAHVLQSYQKSSLVSIGLGANWQFSKKKRANIEQMADKITIHHGLGYALLEKRLDSYNRSASTEQLNYIKKIYLKPNEIFKEIDKVTTKPNDEND